jgi:hypothetical protein
VYSLASSGGLYHADSFFILAECFKFYDSGDFRKKGVILTPANVSARVNPRTALPHQDAPGRDFLPGESFDAEALPPAVTPILGTAYAFFMSHDKILLFRYLDNNSNLGGKIRKLDLGEQLPVSGFPSVFFSSFLLEDDYFLVFAVADNLSLQRFAFDVGLADFHRLVIGP